jgi:hypothetical protein
MTVSVEDVAAYVNASSAEPTLPGILLDAIELVAEYLGESGAQSCPARTRDLAVRQLASELFARRNSPGGVAQWGPDGQPVRLARDVMVSVRPLLAPYRSLGCVG